MLTGQTHIEEPASGDRVLQAIASWQQDSAEEADRTVTSHAPKGKPVVAGPTQEPALPPSSLSVNQSPAEVGFESLADRRAGVQARAQADALRRAAPVRTILARLFGIHTEARAWSKGARGEEKVGAELAKLADRDPQWRVLHSIPVGHRGSDIDHLVIGPGGVYTLNAKHHRGAKIWIGGNTFIVNGQRLPYLRNSRYEAQRATKLLSAAIGRPVAVTAVIVHVGVHGVVIKTPPADVHVVDRAALVTWLRRRPETLDAPTIEAVFEVASRSTTWRPR